MLSNSVGQRWIGALGLCAALLVSGTAQAVPVVHDIVSGFVNISVKLDGATIGEFRSDGSYTIIVGQHPSGCQYRFINEARPIALSYQSLVWPESANTHTPPLTSSVTLNSEIFTLYNNNTDTSSDDTLSTNSILASIASRKVATASFERAYPALAGLYSDFIENRFRAVAGGRNSFLTVLTFQ